jgi:hypothetical protein
MLVENLSEGGSVISRFESIWMPADGIQMEIAASAVIVRAGERKAQQQRIHLVIVPAVGEHRDGIAGAIDPVIVGIDAEEGIVGDQRQRVDKATTGFEQLAALVRNGDLEPVVAPLHMRFERIGEIMDIDHRALHASGGKMPEDMVEQGRPRDLDQRFGPRRGQRTHPLAEAGRHHHRGAGDGRIDGKGTRLAHSPSLSQMSARF